MSCGLEPPPIQSPYDGEEGKSRFVSAWEQWFSRITQFVCDSMLRVEKGGLQVDNVNDIVVGGNMTLVKNKDRTVTIDAQQGGHIIQDEGVDLPKEPRLNFIGAAVTGTDNPGISTDITITGTVVFGGWVSVTMVAGGAGGATSTAATAPGGGGGAGESVETFAIKLTPGGVYSYSVGAGGATDANGADSTFAVLTCLGGKKGSGTSGGNGGGTRGGIGGTGSNPGGNGNFGNPETASFYGGSAGGGGGTATTAPGGPGGGSGGSLVGGAGGVAAGSQGGGGGGASSIYGKGGDGGAGGAVGVAASATNYGAGGGGGGGFASGKAAGAGAGGYILITYIGGAVEFTSGSGTWTAPT